MALRRSPGASHFQTSPNPPRRSGAIRRQPGMGSSLGCLANDIRGVLALGGSTRGGGLLPNKLPGAQSAAPERTEWPGTEPALSKPRLQTGVGLRIVDCGLPIADQKPGNPARGLTSLIF